MKKRITFDYDDSGLTIAKLRVGEKTYFGTAQKHPDDKFNASYGVGVEIAEARAYIHYINDKISDKTIELKSLKRVLYAMPKETQGRNYVENVYKAICLEIADLKGERYLLKQKINNVIEGRNIYIRSRSATKEEKEKMRAAIQEGFKTISQVKSAKEEE